MHATVRKSAVTTASGTSAPPAAAGYQPTSENPSPTEAMMKIGRASTAGSAAGGACRATWSPETAPTPDPATGACALTSVILVNPPWFCQRVTCLLQAAQPSSARSAVIAVKGLGHAGRLASFLQLDCGLDDPVGSRAAEGSRLGPLDIHVDPLMVIGGIGKLVDHLLVDLSPLAVAEMGSGPGLQIGRAHV